MLGIGSTLCGGGPGEGAAGLIGRKSGIVKAAEVISFESYFRAIALLEVSSNENVTTRESIDHSGGIQCTLYVTRFGARGD